MNVNFLEGIGDAYPSGIVDPDAGTIFFPSDPEVVTGPGVAVGLDPGFTADDPEPLDARGQIIPLEKAPFQRVRNVRLVNETKDKIVVHLKYRIPVQGGGQWFPADPAPAEMEGEEPAPEEEGDDLVFEMQPGDEFDVLDYMQEDWRIEANGLRLWAETGGEVTWDQFKDETLWIVEKDNDGKRRYRSPVIQTTVISIK
jgi:hypothetical protein